MAVRGVDEVGQLSTSFEQMRVSLKARLEELNRLLAVSQSVAANLDISDAVLPILEAALVNGANAARMVLVSDVTLDANQKGPVSFGVGPSSQAYTYYDNQLFELARHQDQVNMPSLARARRLQVDAGQVAPGSLLALAIRHEDRYYGVLWVAYDRIRNFSEEEVRS